MAKQTNRVFSLWQLIASIGIAEGVGLLGSLFTFPAIDSWYATLSKPEFSPPNWVFGPVWSLLYALMGIAAYLVWQRLEKPGAKTALIYYALQLVANFWWSIVFFGAKNIAGALFEIAVLWLLIVLTTIGFSRVSKTAAWLMAPYIAWVSFASYLNYSLYILNR